MRRTQAHHRPCAAYGLGLAPKRGRSWGGAASNRDYSRFYHYPYVYYPQNFYGSEYYRSSDSMYYRYAPEAQIPVYNRHWYNEYPTNRRYHWGHHFILDVF
ncbi:MAG: calmodulin-binding protein [Pirellula sp.]